MTTTPRPPAHRKPLVPALVLATLLGASAVTALTQSMGPAFAAAPVQGGYIDLVARVEPAVVTIEVSKTLGTGTTGQELQKGSPLDDFAQRFGFALPDMPQGEGGHQMLGAGTGFIVSASGEIVTNAHVVGGADSVKVTLTDGRSFDATVTGLDEATDIAVLKIDASGLPYVGFGESDGLQVGQNVIAIGNPFGLGNTVTTGIVSAIGRDLGEGPFDNFIQTDAAINRGNSGGPLFNELGEVVGMNTAIISPTGGSVGIGFAVPSDMVKRVVADLEDGTVERGWLGVQISPVSDEVAAALGLEGTGGAMVVDVQPGTPAETAGLKKGDIVTQVDGAQVTDPRGLTRIIAGDAPGAKVSLVVLRRGDTLELSVTLGTRDDQPA